MNFDYGFCISISPQDPAYSSIEKAVCSLFKWWHFVPEIIVLNVRWYCRYALSYRNLEEMMTELEVEVDHSTINRWVLKYALKLDRRVRPHLNFMPSIKQDAKAVARFFRKVLKAQHTQTPRVIRVNKNTAYPVVMETLKKLQHSLIIANPRLAHKVPRNRDADSLRLLVTLVELAEVLLP